MNLKAIMMASVAVTTLANIGSAQATEITTLPGPATTERVYGNGASLPAPYWRQAADCYSVKYDLIFAGSPPTKVAIGDFNYTGEPSQNCATTDYVSNRQVRYMSTGSGTGIKAFFSHDPVVAGDTDPAAGPQYFPRINYALSETSLSAAEVTIYNGGGTNSTVGVTVVAPGVTPGAGQYANPAESYGAMIQFPLLVASVTIAYDPVYKKVRNGDGTITEYLIRNRWERVDNSGGLHLNQSTVCGIFNGDIVNWNQINSATLNKSSRYHDLADPAGGIGYSIPLQIVARRDSSGTSSLWTRFLANACASHPGNSYANSTSRMPGVYKEGSSTRTTATLNKDLVGAVWEKSSDNYGAGAVFANPADNGPETLGTYTVADGNDGVAKYIDFTQNPSATPGDTVVQSRMGYVGPDYVLPGVLFTQANTYGLKTADVQNLAGDFRAPTAVNVQQAFKSLLAPETNSAGAYVANTTCGTVGETGKCRKNPQDWVEAADKASPLANPAGSLSVYPIVGTSNFMGYSCLEKAYMQRTLLSFLGNYYESHKTVNDINIGLLVSSGFAPVSASWRKAIKETFFNEADPAGLGLVMSYVGGDAKCAGKVGG